MKWYTRFEICCSANGWKDEVKAKRLSMLLEGKALAVWLELNQGEQKSYKNAKAKIIEEMSPVQFVSIDGFHRRKLLPSEPLSVFTHELKRLID